MPALRPNGSKNPSGEVCPARPSADIESLFIETRPMEAAGRKATAEAAREAMMIVWNILIDLIVLGIVRNCALIYQEEREE